MIGRLEATLIKRFVQIVVSVLLAASTLGAADSKPFSFPRSTPEAQGVSSAALLGFIEAAEQQIDALHSFMLVRHGHVVAEGWWAPYAAERTAHAVLVEQELHVHGRGAGGRRRPALD